MPTSNMAPARLGIRKLSTDIGYTLGRQFLALLFGLGTASIIARVLGPEGNGQYAIVLLLPTFLTTFLNLGIGPANVYFVGRHSVPPRVAARASVRVWLVLTVVGATVGAFSIIVYSQQLFPGIPSILLWVGLLAFPLGLLREYLLSLFQGVQDFRRYNLASLAMPAVLFVLVSLSLLLGADVITIVIVSVSAQALNVGITYLLLRPVTAAKAESGSNWARYGRQAIQYGYKAHLSNALTFINYRADVFLVNLLINPAATGIYVIAVAMSEKLWVLSQAVSTVILPRLSELHTEEEIRSQLTPFIARWVSILTALAASGLALAALPLIKVFFGDAYLGAVTPLLFLLPGIVAGSLSRVLANDIAARGRPELNMYTSVIVVTTNIVANLLLIPYMGITGAALATTLAYSLNCVFRLWIYSSISGNRWYVHFVFNAHDALVLRRGKHLLFGSRVEA